MKKLTILKIGVFAFFGFLFFQVNAQQGEPNFATISKDYVIQVDVTAPPSDSYTFSIAHLKENIQIID